MFVREAKQILRGSKLDPGYSDKDWNEEWNKLTKDGIYEVPFGDYFIYGKI